MVKGRACVRGNGARLLWTTTALLIAFVCFAAPAFGHGAPKGSPGFSGPAGGPGGKVRLTTEHGAALGKRGKKARSAQATSASTLILYDSTGPYAWLGQAYATMTANLASQFGSWTAKPVARYAAGEIERYTATIYIGSTYDEPLPAAFLADVPKSAKPVIWVYDNIWSLRAATPDFVERYGWRDWQFRACDSCGTLNSPVTEVEYKGRSIARNGLNQGGIMDYSPIDNARVQTLATAVDANGNRFPWAIRSGNLTYVGENPFTYFGEGDRMMIFADLLFDALAPTRPERHRALVRIEDITPANDPDELRAIADYLSSRKVPFSFGVVPIHLDPNGTYNGGQPLQRKLKDDKELVAALKYMQSKGGTLVSHGYTHQYGKAKNPYNAVSGDDFEFYRVTENPDFTLTFHGPVAEDSTAWVKKRIDDAMKELKDAKFAQPTIFEFPHYSGSVLDYRHVAGRFAARYERSLYPLGSMTNTTPDYSRVIGQLFPYAVRDVYGQRVIPENLGNVEPEPFHQFPTRSPQEIVRDAERNLVVRDGFASFYFHPFFDINLLKETVEGIQRLGYTFVAPTTL